MTRLFNLLTLFALTALSATVAAQQYPSKPVRILVGYAPGGGTDLAARTIAQHLTVSLGQPVTVENRPGAGSNIAGDLVARAEPDGYTLLVGAGQLATNPSAHARMPYDPIKDLSPIILMVSMPNTIVVSPMLPVANINELIAYAKKNPDALTCASSGVGSVGHLSCELFNRQAGIKMQHTAYKGSTAAIPDLISGRVQVLFDHVPVPLPYMKAGKLRIIAVTSRERNANLPETPTADASGLPGFFTNTWLALFAPAGTSREVIVRLNGEIEKILRRPEVFEKFSAMGMDVVGGPPEHLAEVLRRDTEKWASVIESAGIKVD